MSTDINEAIARWMGWKRSIDHPRDDPPHAKCDCWTSPHGEHFDGPPAYTSSLDAQVPVWEALAKRDVSLQVGMRVVERTPFAIAQSPKFRLLKDSASPAEAGARAIHAALVAMGEVEDV